MDMSNYVLDGMRNRVSGRSTKEFTTAECEEAEFAVESEACNVTFDAMIEEAEFTDDMDEKQKQAEIAFAACSAAAQLAMDATTDERLKEVIAALYL